MKITVSGTEKEVKDGLTLPELIEMENVETPEYVTVSINEEFVESAAKSQIVCISLLWLALCYLVLTKAERIDGMTVVMLVISAALVFIPVYKSIKKNK